MSSSDCSQNGSLIKAIVHSFNMGDVDDPDIYAGSPIYEWQQTEVGKYCIEKSVEQLYYTIGADPFSYGYRVTITGIFKEQDYTFFKLKFQ